MHIAVDLPGGDRAPGAVVDGVFAALAADRALAVSLVGPPARVRGLLAGRPGALSVVAANPLTGAAGDPARAVRASRDATVRAAPRLVRDGAAAAWVSFNPAPALAGARFTFARLPGVTRPGLAVSLPTPRGPVVLLDVGGEPEAPADLLAQFALAGAAYARVAHGVAEPRVGVLSSGQGDRLRRDGQALLAGLPVHFVGSVDGARVALGGTADVVVADGFTGNVLAKGLEGALEAVIEGLAAAVGADHPSVGLVRDQARRLGPAGRGAVLLGLEGVLVVGPEGAGPGVVAACVHAAVRAVRTGVVPAVRAALAELVTRRRVTAGLTAVPR